MAWVEDLKVLCYLEMGLRSWGPLHCSICSLQHFQSNGHPYRYAIETRHSMARWIIEESAVQYHSTGKYQRLMAFVRFGNLLREVFGLSSCFARIMLLVFTYCCSQSRYLFMVFALDDLPAACCGMAFPILWDLSSFSQLFTINARSSIPQPYQQHKQPTRTIHYTRRRIFTDNQPILNCHMQSASTLPQAQLYCSLIRITLHHLCS